MFMRPHATFPKHSEGMTIRVNVSRTCDTTRIFAWPNDEKSTETVVFHHTGCLNALQKTTRPKHCDDDYFVDFTSSTSFEDFCQILKQYDSLDYDKYTNNCANGADFALRVAGIKLNLPNAYNITYQHPSSYIPIPGMILTPYAFYEAARKHKLQLEHNQQINQAIVVAQQSLDALKKQTADETIHHDVNTIMLKINERLNLNPHHAKFYLDVLIHTNELLIRLIKKVENHQNQIAYLESAAFFKRRLPSQSIKLFDKSSLLLLAMLGILKLLNSSNRKPAIAGFVLYVSTAGLMLRKIHLYLQQKNAAKLLEESHRVGTKLDSSLSLAMIHLSQHAGELQRRF